MRVIHFIKSIFSLIYSSQNPVDYAKRIGVSMGQDVHIYGSSRCMFGSEPWCVTIGNHVHITGDVVFITHDGGTLLYRHLVSDLEITKPIKIGSSLFQVGDDIRSVYCGVTNKASNQYAHE